MIKKTNQILLIKDVKSLGQFGSIVTVKTGYSRNYLLPFKLGKVATNEAIKEFEEKQEKIFFKEKLIRNEQINFKNLLENLVGLKLKKEVVSNTDQLFGKITKNDILLLLENQLPPTKKIEKQQIELPLIEKLGQYKITIYFEKDIFAKVPLEIITT
ncbi:unnamed protein product [Dictyota dichotoma]